jgi:predicted Zn-dependent peptidase
MHRKVLAGFWVLAISLILGQPALAQDIAKLESQVTTFTLDNGLRFIVVERHDAPVFTYFAQVKVGSVNEEAGRTGLAHMFEHMAFKGTTEIGTSNWSKEKRALADSDEAYASWWSAKLDGVSDTELEALWQNFKDSQDAAREHVVTNEFGTIIERNGGTGLNASTQPDVTTYFYNLPSNRLELWAYLESERFKDPVMREFYTERDVVIEERRMRTESSPIGRLIEEFMAICFLGHPYGQPTVGHLSDLQSFSREEAMDLYRRYYVPSNIVIGLAGDVDPVEAEKLANEYFGDWKAAPMPEPVRTLEPTQRGERRVAIEDPGQPFLLVGYHKPSINDPDATGYEMLTSLVANGRSSRLHERLVKDEKKAVAVGAITQFPGQLYPGLFLLFAVPAKGVPALELEEAVLTELQRLKDELVPADELEGVKTRMKANFIRQMQSSQGMVSSLVGSELLEEDWHRGLSYPLDVDAVTAEDLQRIARECFTATNRNVGYIITEEEEGADDAS